MKLILPDDDLRITIEKEKASELYIYHKSQYVKLIRSLEEEAFLESPYPYLIENNRNEIVEKRGQYYLIQDCLHFPEFTANMKSKLYEMARCYLRDELILSGIEKQYEDMLDTILRINDTMWGSYDFKSNWDFIQFLKAFKLEPTVPNRFSVLDNQIAFYELLCDLNLQKPVIYANMRKNIDGDDLKILIDQANYYQIPLLFIESGSVDFETTGPSAYIIDQDFCVFKSN